MLRQSRLAKQAGIPTIRHFEFLLALVSSGRNLSWNLDPSTLGALFLAMCDEMTDIRYADAIALLLHLLAQAVDGTLPDTTAKIREAVQHFIACLPSAVKERLAAWGCET